MLKSQIHILLTWMIKTQRTGLLITNLTILKNKKKLMSVIQNSMSMSISGKMAWNVLSSMKVRQLKVWLSNSVRSMDWMMTWKKSLSSYWTNRLQECYQKSWRMQMPILKKRVTGKMMGTIKFKAEKLRELKNEILEWLKFNHLNNTEYTYFNKSFQNF